MRHAHVEVARSISNVADASKNVHASKNVRASKKIIFERGERMVEFDQFKFILNQYEGPLVEVRDSL